MQQDHILIAYYRINRNIIFHPAILIRCCCRFVKIISYFIRLFHIVFASVTSVVFYYHCFILSIFHSLFLPRLDFFRLCILEVFFYVLRSTFQPLVPVLSLKPYCLLRWWPTWAGSSCILCSMIGRDHIPTPMHNVLFTWATPLHTISCGIITVTEAEILQHPVYASAPIVSGVELGRVELGTSETYHLPL